MDIAEYHPWSKPITVPLWQNKRKSSPRCRCICSTKKPDGFYIDDGISGTIDFDDRPQGKALKNVLEPNDVVLCSKLDRLIRRISVLCKIRDDFNDANIHLFAHDILGGAESISTSMSPSAKMFVNIMATFAEWDRDSTAAKLHTGKLRVEQEGRYIGGGVPYGYRLEKRGRHNYLVEVPEQQDIIRYVDTSMIRFKKMGKKAPWRRLSNQIGSLYKRRHATVEGSKNCREKT
jgi:DNA invertase Pin-like site-specific DNA recombinase